MKKVLLIISFLTCLVVLSMAQNPGKEKPGARIQALKIAYITKKLDLSPEEAQRFWPVFNQYKEEIADIRLDQKIKGISELDTEEKILKVRKKYSGEFVKALNAEKTNKFFQVEKEFDTFVHKELQERRELRQQRNTN